MKIAPHAVWPAARAVLAGGIARLEAAGVPSAALAAELLLLHVVGRDRTWLYTHPEDRLSSQEESAYANLIERRAAGTPTQYLTGRQEFWGLDFDVTPDVLIPRPETEHVVEVALARLGERRSAPLRIADVGTGSGCLAVALARELPLARVTATDISAAALEIARRNAARHGVAARIEFLRINLLDFYAMDSMAAAANGSAPTLRFDLIVSNPPYIARDQADSLAREVRDHEPALALFGGDTGVELYPALITQAEALLSQGGLLVVELGHDSAERVRPLLSEPAWSGIAIADDLAGIPRVLSALRG